jgi:hypothetical protein
MKYYKLLTKIAAYEVGTIFNFNAKHLLMSELDFTLQREVLWEETTKEEAIYNSHYFVDGDRLVNFGDLDLVRLMH